MSFSMPWENYRYKRLAFEGLNSQDLFDAEIAKIISGVMFKVSGRATLGQAHFREQESTW